MFKSRCCLGVFALVLLGLFVSSEIEARGRSRGRNRISPPRNSGLSSTRFRSPIRFRSQRLTPIVSQPIIPNPLLPGDPIHSDPGTGPTPVRPVAPRPIENPIIGIPEDFSKDPNLFDGPSCVDASLKDCRTLKQIVSSCSSAVFPSIRACQEANGEASPLRDCSYPRSSGENSLQVIVKGVYLLEEIGIFKEGGT